MTDIFGPIVTGGDVEDAVVDTLKLWFPTYLAQMERKTGRDPQTLSAPRSYLVSSRFERRPQDQIPACIVISPGMTNAPVRHGDGTLSGTWRIEVGVAVKGKDRGVVNELSKLYAAATLLIFAQRGSLGGFASGVTVIGSSNDELPTNILDIGAYSLVLADVDVAAIANTNGGPSEPDLDPGDLEEFDTVHIDIQRRSLV